MFDTRTFENFRYLLEEAVRDYTRANSENQKLLLLIGQAAFDGDNELTDRMQQYRAEYEDNKVTMTVSKDQFEFTKRKMLDMINTLAMPE